MLSICPFICSDLPSFQLKEANRRRIMLPCIAHLANLFATEEEKQPTSTTPTKEPEPEAPTPLPVALSDETRQELAQRNEARHDSLERWGA
jgi:hypothetical protein